jgi:hypothetical protein
VCYNKGFGLSHLIVSQTKNEAGKVLCLIKRKAGSLTFTQTLRPATRRAFMLELNEFLF